MLSGALCTCYGKCAAGAQGLVCVGKLSASVLRTLLAGLLLLPPLPALATASTRRRRIKDESSLPARP